MGRKILPGVAADVKENAKARRVGLSRQEDTSGRDSTDDLGNEHLTTADQGRLVAALEDLNLEKPGSPKIVAGDLKRRERLFFWPLTALFIAFLVAMAVFLFYMYYTYGW